MKARLVVLCALLLLGAIQNAFGQYTGPKVRVAGNINHSYGKDSAHLSQAENFFVKDGIVYICDIANNRIMKWLAGAKYGEAIAGNKNDTAGSDSTLLSGPSDLTMDASGNLFIVDVSNHRVQKYAPGSKYGVTVAGQKVRASGSDSAHLNIP